MLGELRNTQIEKGPEKYRKARENEEANIF